MKKIFSVNDEFVDSRLDRWFRKNIYDAPQSLIEKNIRKGHIKVNKKKTKSSYRIKKLDQIIIGDIKFKEDKSKAKKRYQATKKELSRTSDFFIENNENFVVINKPAGIAVQAGTKTKRNIIDILRGTKEFEEAQPYTVHRIDKETSGLLIVAKNRSYAQLFTSLFRIRKIHKVYLGVVIGLLEKSKGTYIDELIYYEGKKTIKAKAITRYSVLDYSKNCSLLILSPETGRKHQLRKQLLMHGTPILGDSKYRITKNYSDRKNNLMLHAFKINFSINNIKYNFRADVPLDFLKTLKEKNLKIS